MNFNNKKLIKVMARFLIVLLFLTFFSRTIYQFNLPLVTATQLSTGILVHSIEGNSPIIQSDNASVRSQTKGRVNNVLVNKGDEISYGQVIAEMELDTAEIARKEFEIIEKQHNIDIELLNLNRLQEGNSASNISIDRKRISNAELAERNEASIQRLRNEIQILEDEIANNEKDPLDAINKANLEHNISLAAEKVSVDQTMYDLGIISLNDLNTSLNALRAAELEYEKFIQQTSITQEETNKRKQDEIDKKNEEIINLQDAIIKDTNELNDMIFQFEQEALESQTDNNIKIMESNFRINKLQQEIASLQQEIESLRNTTLVSQTQGIITDVKVEVGQLINEGDVIIEVLDTQGEYLVELVVNEKQIDKITPESIIEIDVRGIPKKLTGNIISIEPTEDNENQYKISILVDNEDFELRGRFANVKIGTQSITYNTIIPNEALRKDSDGNFVLVLREEDNVLGQQYIAQRINVQLLDSDSKYSAIEGMFNPEPIIASSTSPVNNGSRVRYEG